MTSSEGNVARLRVKDILDVGLTYMVLKVFSDLLRDFQQNP